MKKQTFDDFDDWAPEPPGPAHFATAVPVPRRLEASRFFGVATRTDSSQTIVFCSASEQTLPGGLCCGHQRQT